MAAGNNSTSKTRRALPKEVRKEQLILATMKCIAKNGLGGITMAQVTKEAGLSTGIANLHFESKGKLLVETLKFVTTEYNQGQAEILTSDKSSTVADRIEAILEFDFSPRVAEKTKIAVWFAFCGEAKSRPTYQKICSNTDFKAEEALGDLFQAAIDEGGYIGLDAALLASGYTALIDGLWLNLLIAPRHMNRATAQQIARNYLAGSLPKHIKAES